MAARGRSLAWAIDLGEGIKRRDHDASKGTDEGGVGDWAMRGRPCRSRILGDEGGKGRDDVGRWKVGSERRSLYQPSRL